MTNLEETIGDSVPISKQLVVLWYAEVEDARRRWVRNFGRHAPVWRLSRIRDKQLNLLKRVTQQPNLCQAIECVDSRLDSALYDFGLSPEYFSGQNIKLCRFIY